MTEQVKSEELDSVIEFSQPIDEQEAPKPLPRGEYVAEITKAVAKKSGKTGSNFAEILFKVSPDRYPHDYKGPEGGTTVRCMKMLSDNDWSRYELKKLYEAVGLKLPKTRIDLQDLLGREAVIEVAHREFPEGSDRFNAEVKSVKKVA